MSTMNISLPDNLKAFVDDEVGARGFSTSSEYVRELIHRDQDRVRLRDLLLAGAASRQGEAVTAEYFEGLCTRVSKAKRAGR